MNKPFSFLPLIITFLFIIPSLSTQNNLLGEISFPNSGSETAQSDFIEGVLFLHNFEYADAARAFQRAQEIDPDFALAYWGEALTHNHPIWMEQDRSRALDVLLKLGDSVNERQQKALTQREKDYLMTIELLYGNVPESEGKSKMERDFTYRDAMKDLHEKYPDDHEAAALYGLSILGTAHDGREYSIYMQAAGELLPIWTENQKHPGAAHYLIHSFDDPVHAPLGLPMAKVYSEIAPAAAHAQHMTSHIFLALGMWEDVVDANIVARDVQTTRQKELDESTTVCGHYPWWLQYGYLQQGNVEKAETVLQTCMDRIDGDPTDGELWHFGIMMAHQVVDSENWSSSEMFSYNFVPDTPGARNYFFTKGYQSVKTGNINDAENYLELLKQTEETVEKEIQVQQLEGMLQIEKGDAETGLTMIHAAVQAESELPIDFGPPTIVKPSLELLGDVQVELGEEQQAVEAYEQQLKRTPDRKRSLAGKEQARKLVFNEP